MAKVCVWRIWFSSAPPTKRLPLFSAYTIKGKCCWFLSCGVFPPPLSAQPPTSSIRNDCREVHFITSKLHLHFIPVSHLSSSSLFYSNFSIHHLFFSLQSSLLFLIYTVFPSQEFCSRRAYTAWIVLVHSWDLFHFLWTSHHHSAAFSAHDHSGTCWTLMYFSLTCPYEHVKGFLQLQLELFPSSSNSFTSWSSVYVAVSFKWFPPNQHCFPTEGSDFSLE